MDLDFIIMFVLMVFFTVPEVIFLHLGLNPEKMTTLPFLLVWILIFSIIYFAVITSLRGIKYIFRDFPKKFAKSTYLTSEQTKNK